MSGFGRTNSNPYTAGKSVLRHVRREREAVSRIMLMALAISAAFMGWAALSSVLALRLTA